MFPIWEENQNGIILKPLFLLGFIVLVRFGFISVQTTTGMESLNVFANNNLGAKFWEQRTGLCGQVEMGTINVMGVQQAIENGANFILVDFYFSKVSSSQEDKLTNKICELVKEANQNVHLFVLSSTHFEEPIQYYEPNSTQIILHNYTEDFLAVLLEASSAIMAINKNQAS